MTDDKINPETGEVLTEQPQKRKVGRPKKSEIVKRAFPGDKQGQLEIGVRDGDERKELVASVMEAGISIYNQPAVKTDEEAAKRIEEYFKGCMNKGVLPTVEGLSLSLGVTRQALLDWETGRYNPSRGPLIARAKELIAEIDAQLVAMGKMPAVPYIFRAKNYYGMSDKTELQVSASAINNLSEEELKKSIRESVVIDGDYEDK
jgi:hypothetical protein